MKLSNSTLQLINMVGGLGGTPVNSGFIAPTSGSGGLPESGTYGDPTGTFADLSTFGTAGVTGTLTGGTAGSEGVAGNPIPTVTNVTFPNNVAFPNNAQFWSTPWTNGDTFTAPVTISTPITNEYVQGFQYPSFQYPIPPPFDLSSLEEGIHDIPGGKIIIKKIKVSESELDQALAEALGHEASLEEKAALHNDLEQFSMSEEREI